MKITRRHFKFSALAGLFSFVARPLFAKKPKEPDPTLDPVDREFAGPLVGHASETTGSLWMYTPTDARVEVRFAKKLSGTERQNAEVEKVAVDDLQLQGRAWKAALANLQPDTRYEYEVAIDGEVQAEHRGSFRTAPPAAAKGKFRLGLTSCMKIQKEQDCWRPFLANRPDLHLSLGDTVYADSTDPKIQWRHHLRYRQSPLFAEVARAMPTYSMWDDHDFGPNNSDGTATGKEGSLDGWQRVWLNPSAGTPEIPGSFYRFAWGEVEFFVVDGRYHRSPNRLTDDEHKTMLGDAQFQWLVDGLKQSQAKFKIVASGSTLEHSQNDGWRVYTHARHQFFDAIKAHTIDGVVYCSGSPHNSFYSEHHESDRVGYPLVEVVSSGIANSKDPSFATIDFDTTIDDPTMTVRIVKTSGKVGKQQTWKLSQLSHV